MPDCTCNNFPLSVGNVTIAASLGIGAYPPAYKLDVFDNSGTYPTARIASNTHTYLYLQRGGVADVGMSYRDENGNRLWSTYIDPTTSRLYHVNGAGYLMVCVTQDGKVGIGANPPSEKLDVNGNIKASGKAAIGTSVDPGANLALGPIDGANEGGEILLRGAGAYGEWRVDNFQGRLRFIPGITEVMVLYPNGNLVVRGNRFYALNIPVDDRYWFAVNGESEANVVLGLWSNAAGTDKRVEIKGDVYVGARKSIDSQGRCLYG